MGIFQVFPALSISCQLSKSDNSPPSLTWFFLGTGTRKEKEEKEEIKEKVEKVEKWETEEKEEKKEQKSVNSYRW